MHPMHQSCPVCNKDIVEELLIPLYGNESDSQPSRKGNGSGGSGGVGGDGVVRGGGSRNGGGNGDSSGDGKETDVSKIPSRPQGVHLPPNPNATNNLAQANPTDGGDLTRVAEAYPQQNNRRFGSTVPGVAFQFGFRLLVTGEAPGYAQQQALLSWMLLLLGSFVVFCLLVFWSLLPLKTKRKWTLSCNCSSSCTCTYSKKSCSPLSRSASGILKLQFSIFFFIFFHAVEHTENAHKSLRAL